MLLLKNLNVKVAPYNCGVKYCEGQEYKNLQGVKTTAIRAF